MLYKSSICRCFFLHLFSTDALDKGQKKNINVKEKLKRKQSKSIENWLLYLCGTKWQQNVIFETVCVCVCPLKRYFNNAKWKISNITVVCTISDKTCSHYTHTWPNPIHLNEMKLGSFWFFVQLRFFPQVVS